MGTEPVSGRGWPSTASAERDGGGVVTAGRGNVSVGVRGMIFSVGLGL